MDWYKRVVRPALFASADPEWSHGRIINTLKHLSRQIAHSKGSSWADFARDRLQERLTFDCERLQMTLWGLTFPNPLGLAAGVDKNGEVGALWGSLGFGFAELGTVTWHPQPGNPPPRLFRLVEDRAALNRMGFNNCGAIEMAKNLDLVRSSRLPSIPLGINLGKSKVTPLEEAVGDYRDSFRQLQNRGDYFVVNVSSPNTPGLRSLQAPEQLESIVNTLIQENRDAKPILVKISPDLDWAAISAVVDLVKEKGLAGIVATNTTISRDGLKTQIVAKTGKSVTEEAGGISGAPLRDRSTAVIRYIWQQTEGKLPIIGTGGVANADDAWEKIAAGASLLEVYTGWIYEGPWMPQQILSGLVRKLDEHGFDRISEAVGLFHRQS
ncbi:MAG: quinone-dependent dihydroorotate dehydrogenase [Cyanobacteria bacterium SID2]|nr:quinone-dependent dihydroorotate dehydrogenase [Cyanobacteria bacterium SID2]MBP0003684.1 quinone-dependent dihydroorotate dehydrogenase [Cyanobacteria bacterium SBC]